MTPDCSLFAGPRQQSAKDGDSCLQEFVRVSSKPSPANSSPPLRLHLEDQPAGPPPLETGPIESLCEAFQQVTGWSMSIEQSPACAGEAWSMTLESYQQPTSRLVLRSASEKGSSATTLAEVRPLARSLAGLLNEVNRLRHAVWQREAELAAGVPVAPRADETQHLAKRLQSVLQAGAEAVRCQAAGLYVLNEATSDLKLRAGFGLPAETLLAPPRPLRGAIADLEALTGHAVVLEDTGLLPHWRCPEDYPAAACVPVSTPSIPLGTLWVFSETLRDFSPEETNLLEIIAGRLAADLEREMLLASGQEAAELEKQFAAGEAWQSDRLPSIAPLVDDYEISGWTKQAGGIGGDFHDWTVLSDSRLALIAGSAGQGRLEGGMAAAALQATAKAHAGYSHSAGRLLTRINDSIITASPGGTAASLGYAILDPETGKLELSLAGNAAVLVIGLDDRLIISTDEPPLGAVPDHRYPEEAARLQVGEVLVFLSNGVRQAIDPAGLRIGEAAIGSLVGRHLAESADEIVSRLKRFIEHPEQVAEDMTVLVLKRHARS